MSNLPAQLLLILGGLMTAVNTQAEPVTPLPHETGSASEVLAASHLFTVEVLKVEGTAWMGGADGLEHRNLDMELRLLDVQKGAIQRPPKAFTLRVEQRRDDELLELSFHGLWSHVAPEVGTRYLVAAEGKSTDPAELMKEGTCQRLLNASLAVDVRLAIEAEQLWQKAHGPDAAAQMKAAKALLEFGLRNRASGHDLLGRYLWVRVMGVFNETEGRLVGEVVQILRAPDTTIELRSSLAAELYAAALLLEPSTEAYRSTAGAFMSMLQQKESTPLHSQIAEVYLYGMVFDAEDNAVLKSESVGDAGSRAGANAVVSKLTSDRSKRLSTWLKG
jgi:hypothetical protein